MAHFCLCWQRFSIHFVQFILTTFSTVGLISIFSIELNQLHVYYSLILMSKSLISLVLTINHSNKNNFLLEYLLNIFLSQHLSSVFARLQAIAFRAAKREVGTHQFKLWNKLLYIQAASCQRAHGRACQIW